MTIKEVKELLLNGFSEKTLEIFEESLKRLVQITGTVEICNSHDAYETITFTQVLLKYQTSARAIKLLSRYKLDEKYAELFQYLCSIRSEFIYEGCRKVIDVQDANVCYLNTSLNERQIFNLMNLDSIFNYILNDSLEFRRLFTRIKDSKKSYLESFIQFTSDYTFIDKMLAFFPKFSGFILNIACISKCADECKEVWNSLNSIQVMLDFGRRYPKWSLSAFGTVSNVASDQDIEKIPEINQMIDQFIIFSNDCIYNRVGFRKLSFKDDETGNEQILEVSYILDKENHFVSVTFLLGCLYKLAVNEKLKLEIYNQKDFGSSLRRLIMNGKDIEKQHALQLLAQLTFNLEVNTKIKNDNELVSYIKNLENKQTDYKKLQKTCKEIIWILDNENNKLIIKPQIAQTSHIMISYNAQSRETCLKVKNELEKLNYKVWIDVSEIHGSSLDSMAKAVENAECVLIFVTEKYRQSLNCQAEAQYAFRLNKTIIPCIVQQGYQNVSGWLGIIIGDKIFVDFSKYKFEESIVRLVNQLRLHNNLTDDRQSNDLNSEMKLLTIEEKPKVITQQGPRTWSNDEVKEWFCANKMETLHEFLSPINGRILTQLYEIKQHTPEFFFKSITKNESIDLKTIAIFSDLLLDLFENK